MPYVEVIFPSGIAAEFAPYYEDAVNFWNGVVLEGVPPHTLTKELDLESHTCAQPHVFSKGHTLEGLTIFASSPYIDGEGQILGRAGPCYFYPGTYWPSIGIMEFDSADSEYMLGTGTYGKVIFHEMGHVLGVGTLWPIEKLLQEPCSLFGFPKPCDPHYLGAHGIAGYNLLNPHAGMPELPPVEDQGGMGTANGHWRETTFSDEIMTGYLNAESDNPLSIMTIMSLMDLGYTVSTDLVEEYVIPEQGVERSGTKIQLLGDIMKFDIDSADVTPEIDSSYDDHLSSMFMLMIIGFFMLMGLQLFLARDVRKAMDRFTQKSTGVANANPMHLNELA